MLYAILCYAPEDAVPPGPRNRTTRSCGTSSPSRRNTPRPASSARWPGCCRPPRRRRCARSRASRWCIDGPFAETKEQLLGFYTVECRRVSRKPSASRENCPTPTRAAAPTRSALSACSHPGHRQPYDRHRLDKPSAHLRQSAGGGGAAALFPRSRHGGRGVPGSLPAGAEELAAERPAARPDRLADLRRPQHRYRRGATPVEARSAAGRAGAVRPRRMPKTRSPSGSTAPTTATTFCGCSSSAAIRTCRRRSRSRWRLRIVSGLSVKQIARAFLVGESGHGAAHHPRQGTDRATADVPFEAPGAVERSERLAAVAAMVYLVFNEGYSASGGDVSMRAPLCDEAIRLARLLLRLFQTEPEIMGLTALMLLQHARSRARFDARRRGRAARRPGPRQMERQDDRRRAGPDRQGDAPPPAPAPTRSRRRSPRCTPAPSGRRTRTGSRSTCSTARWRRSSPRRSSRSTAPSPCRSRADPRPRLT